MPSGLSFLWSSLCFAAVCIVRVFFLKYAIFLCGLVLVSPLFFAAASSLASRSENGHLLLLPVSLVTDYSSPSCCE
ncbi:hypothetical protein BJV77DRAFT_595227 [Russula vinacea]|nr:hypothetical protein BJV77DRAFT_595227 [Russula vinacea]